VSRKRGGNLEGGRERLGIFQRMFVELRQSSLGRGRRENEVLTVSRVPRDREHHSKKGGGERFRRREEESENQNLKDFEGTNAGECKIQSGLESRVDKMVATET